MKRLLSFALALVLLLCVFPISTSAVEVRDRIYFDNGDYMTVEIIKKTTRTTESVIAEKRYTYYNHNGTSDWAATLKGSFTYTGVTATCTSSFMNVSISESNWYTISKSASKSGNAATGSVTMGLKSAGVTVLRVPISLTLTYDANGNLS